MSGTRRGLQKAKLRRDRIRRERHAASSTPPPCDREPGGQTPPFLKAHPLAMERPMRQVQALMEDQQLESVEEANAGLAEAESAPARARKVNPFVLVAPVCARDHACASESHPGVREWVGER